MISRWNTKIAKREEEKNRWWFEIKNSDRWSDRRWSDIGMRFYSLAVSCCSSFFFCLHLRRHRFVFGTTAHHRRHTPPPWLDVSKHSDTYICMKKRCFSSLFRCFFFSSSVLFILNSESVIVWPIWFGHRFSFALFDTLLSFRFYYHVPSSKCSYFLHHYLFNRRFFWAIKYTWLFFFLLESVDIIIS